MTPEKIIIIILLGGLLGIFGQGIRMVVGLKKLSEENAKLLDGETSEVNITRLLTSIFIGFVAGGLYALINQPPSTDIPNQFYVTVIGAGYAGTDFIEGLFNTYISKKAPATIVTNPDTTKEPSPEKPKEPEQPKEPIAVENETIVQQKPLG